MKTPLDGSTDPVEMNDLIKLTYSQGIKVAIGYFSFFNLQSVLTISRINNSSREQFIMEHMLMKNQCKNDLLYYSIVVMMWVYNKMGLCLSEVMFRISFPG